MDPNDITMTEETEMQKPQPLAFTINFSDGKDVIPKVFRDNLARYTRHVRNASLPNVEESMKPVRNSANSVQAVSMSPLAARKSILSKRPGYHSEGYFSSDQEDDLRAKSDIFVRKFKSIDKGIRTTNLAQEKKIMADQLSWRKVNLCVQSGAQECTDVNVETSFQNNVMGDNDDDEDDDDDYNAPPHPPAGSPLTLPDTKEHIFPDTKGWLVPDDDLEIPSDPREIPVVDEAGGELDDVLNDSSNDTVSEAGTYTIERDTLCPEVMRARQDLENVILKIGQMHTFSNDGANNESTFKRSLYSDGSHWINEWASQVAKHNHNGEYENSSISGLPSVPIGKQQGPTPVSTSKLSSPVHQMHLPLKSSKFTAPSRAAPCIPPSSLTRVVVNEPSSSSDGVNLERHSDSSLETESFLRATESVVSAMQARMTLSMDSGGESDVDTSHSYKGSEKCRGQQSGLVVGERYLTARRPSNASDASGHIENRAARSDSSSEAGENKNKKKDALGASTPQMRYNRAFSLRRARLEGEPESPTADKKKKAAAMEGAGAITAKAKKPSEPVRATPQKAVKAKSPKSETFSRTDSGRFSIKSAKATTQVTKTTVVKKDSKRSAGGRSNSTLSSREVEFQNWKRRKSYDPMKAAAEGKKKEAAKKAHMSSSMTQASIGDPESSPSRQNPVLRSASFHGTGGMTPNYISSEEEVTLSADEDSPISDVRCPTSLVASSSPSKVNDYELQAILEGTFGGSRSSLHSTASNSSVGRRAKLEALDSLVMAAVCGLSNKIRGHSCKLLKKLRYLYDDDSERAEKLSDVIDLLETTAPPESPQTKSPSKELSGTLKNLKRIETVFKVLDDVLFDEEDFDQDLECYQ